MLKSKYEVSYFKSPFGDGKLTSEKWLDSLKIAELCKKENYYNDGSNDDYEAMLEFAHKHAATDVAIYRIAEDIIAHTDIRNIHLEYYTLDEMIVHIMFYINKDCTYTTYAIEREGF